MLADETRISPSYTAGEWRALAFDTEQDWNTAIAIAEDRIGRRFLDPVQAMMDSDGVGSWCGFAVLAIDCLLIETLYAFEHGLPNTRNQSRKAFIRFLLASPVFAAHFDERTAADFYSQVRCGILHQSETVDGALVRTSTDCQVVSLTEDGGQLVVNRNLFHQGLVQHFNDYLALLRGGDRTLRANLRRKLDAICR